MSDKKKVFTVEMNIHAVNMIANMVESEEIIQEITNVHPDRRRAFRHLLYAMAIATGADPDELSRDEKGVDDIDRQYERDMEAWKAKEALFQNRGDRDHPDA